MRRLTPKREKLSASRMWCTPIAVSEHLNDAISSRVYGTCLLAAVVREAWAM